MLFEEEIEALSNQLQELGEDMRGLPGLKKRGEYDLFYNVEQDDNKEFRFEDKLFKGNFKLDHGCFDNLDRWKDEDFSDFFYYFSSDEYGIPEIEEKHMHSSDYICRFLLTISYIVYRDRRLKEGSIKLLNGLYCIPLVEDDTAMIYSSFDEELEDHDHDRQNEKKEELGAIVEKISQHTKRRKNTCYYLNEAEILSFLKTSHDIPYDKFRSKPVRNYFTHNFYNFTTANKIYVYGVTCTNPPDVLGSKEDEWKKIIRRIELCLGEITDTISQIAFILLSIEEHPQVQAEVTDENGKKQKVLVDGPLTGYPHVHFALAFYNTDGKQYIEEELGKFFYGDNKFQDVQVGGTKIKPKNVKMKSLSETKRVGGRPIQVLGDNFTNLICYVVKNARHKNAFVKLQGMYPLTLIDYSKTSDVKDFFEKLNTLGNYHIKFHYDRMEPLTSSPNDHLFELGKNSAEEAIAYVRYKMREEGYKLCNGYLHVKAVGSRMTYVRSELSLDDFFASITTADKFTLISRHQSNLIEKMSNKFQILFDKIEISYSHIEFADFFLHFLPDQFQCLDTCNIPCYKFISNCNLKQFTHGFPVHFFTAIANQGYPVEITADLLSSFFGMLLPRVSKNATIQIYGCPNSGKTAITNAIIEIKGYEKVVMFGDQPSKHTTSLLMDIENPLLVFNESSGLNSIDNPTKLILLEGNGRLYMEKKYQHGVHKSFCLSALIISNDDMFKNLNVSEWMLDAFGKRVVGFPFNIPFDESQMKPNFRELIKSEEGLVIGLMVKSYYAPYASKSQRDSFYNLLRKHTRNANMYKSVDEFRKIAYNRDEAY